MRTPRNETASLDPTRTCILSRQPGTRDALIRLAIGPDGSVAPDIRARAPGRGAWIGVDRATLDAANARGKLKGALARAFKGAALTIPDDLGQRIADALERAALDRLGLEARASTIATGSDRIADAARKGALHALYHAADAQPDGRAKLAQAWRVGSDSEGSGRAGTVLPFDRDTLSMALGRDNVVHIGVIDAAAAGRIGAAVDRWRAFSGPPVVPQPCAPPAQGPTGASGAGPLVAAEMIDGQEGFGFIHE